MGATASVPPGKVLILAPSHETSLSAFTLLTKEDADDIYSFHQARVVVAGRELEITRLPLSFPSPVYAGDQVYFHARQAAVEAAIAFVFAVSQSDENVLSPLEEKFFECVPEGRPIVVLPSGFTLHGSKNLLLRLSTSFPRRNFKFFSGEREECVQAVLASLPRKSDQVE